VLNDDEYTEEELDGLNTWFQLTHEKLPQEPFTFYFAKLKSGSEETKELFADPKAVLRSGHEALPALSEQNALIGEDTLVTTTIFGHDRTLKARLVYVMVAVDGQDNSASMTSHKSR
jgi:hypothetical protein